MDGHEVFSKGNTSVKLFGNATVFHQLFTSDDGCPETAMIEREQRRIASSFLLSLSSMHVRMFVDSTRDCMVRD